MSSPVKTLKVTLLRSTNRRTERHKSCVLGLGLKRIGQTVEVAATAANWGMVKAVSYLLHVEELHD